MNGLLNKCQGKIVNNIYEQDIDICKDPKKFQRFPVGFFLLLIITMQYSLMSDTYKSNSEKETILFLESEAQRSHLAVTVSFNLRITYESENQECQGDG